MGVSGGTEGCFTASVFNFDVKTESRQLMDLRRFFDVSWRKMTPPSD